MFNCGILMTYGEKMAPNVAAIHAGIMEIG